MELCLSVAARDRRFSRAIQRVRPRFEPLLDRVSKLELTNPIHSAILVGITDDNGSEHFREVPNDEGFFQVVAGCELQTSDGKLTRQVFEILRRATKACPLTPADQASVQAIFDHCERDVVEGA